MNCNEEDCNNCWHYSMLKKSCNIKECRYCDENNKCNFKEKYGDPYFECNKFPINDLPPMQPYVLLVRSIRWITQAKLAIENQVYFHSKEGKEFIEFLRNHSEAKNYGISNESEYFDELTEALEALEDIYSKLARIVKMELDEKMEMNQHE